MMRNIVFKHYVRRGLGRNVLIILKNVNASSHVHFSSIVLFTLNHGHPAVALVRYTSFTAQSHYGNVIGHGGHHMSHRILSHHSIGINLFVQAHQTRLVYDEIVNIFHFKPYHEHHFKSIRCHTFHEPAQLPKNLVIKLRQPVIK